MSTIPFACPGCQFSQPIDARYAGQVLGCPGCGQPVTVGAPAPPAGSPPGVIDFACARCGTRSRVGAQYAGQQAQCRSCGNVIPVPHASQGAPPHAPQAPQPQQGSPGTIRFSCACGNVIEVAASHAGMRGQCDACGGPVQVPGGAPPQQAVGGPVAPPQQPPAAPPGMIVFNCPNCGTPSQAEEQYAGMQVQCPACQAGFAIPGSPAPAPAAPAAKAPARGGLDLAPLDLAEPDPEPEPEPEPEDDEPDEDERPRRRGKGKRKRKRKAPADDPEDADEGPGGECPFCFASIAASAAKCPSCGMDLDGGLPGERSRGRSGGRKRARSYGGGGAVQVFAALSGGIADFTRNAVVCLLAVFLFQIATMISSVVCGFGGGLVAGVVGGVPGLLLGTLLAVVLSMVVVTVFLQGQFAIYLACARGEEPRLGQLFGQPLSGGVSGFAVQVVVMIAYVGLCFGIGFFVSMAASIPAAIASVLVFFLASCLLVLICGLAQIYIVDQGLGFGDALAAANGAVSRNTPKLLGYSALCLCVIFLAVILVGFVLNVLGLAPSPIQPSGAKIVICMLVQAATNMALWAILGTSLTRIYLQVSR